MRDRLHRAVSGPDTGFTLVEVMVAIVVLGIMAAAVVGVILQTQSGQVTNRARIAAANLAAREIDMVRDQFHRSSTAPVDIAEQGTVVNPDPMDGQAAGDPFVIDGQSYTVTRSSTWNILGTGQSACDGGSLVKYPTLGVTVTVTWPHMGSVKPVTSTAQLAPDKGSGVPGADSFIAVKVKDQAGQPSAGRTVLVQGGGQTVTHTTDASGCAVIEVSPAAAPGTTYTAQVTDAGYVDISDATAPTKAVGTVAQGQLNNNVTFQVAQAGTVVVDLVDSAGNPVTNPPAGAQVTLNAKEFSGASPAKQYPVTGPEVTIGNLWPTDYGAYYGDTPPASGFDTQTLEPGGTLTLTATLQLATTTISGLTAGQTVYGRTDGGSSCGSGATVLGTVGADGTLTISVPPDDWTFLASFPTAACSPGPTVTLIGGPNGGIAWDTETLTVAGGPAGSTVYAAEQSKVTNGSACPVTAQAGTVVTVPAAGATVPAGTWYVWAVSGASCARSTGQASIVINYGQDTTMTWGGHTSGLSVTGIAPIATVSVKHSTTYYWPALYLSPTPVSGLTCSASGVKVTSTGQTLSPMSTSGSGSTRSASATVQQGTTYLIANDENQSNGQTQWTSPRCKLAGTVNVGPYTGNLTLAYGLGKTPPTAPTVGP